MIGSTLRLVDPDTGAEVFNAGPSFGPGNDAPFLNSLDFGWPSVRSTSAPISGAHGETDTTKWVGARAITAEMTLPQGVAADGALDVIAGLMDPGERWWLYAQRPGWPSERRILVRGSGLPCPPGTVRKTQAGFVAPAGLFEDSVVSTVVLALSGSGAGGFSAPFTMPLALASGLVSGASLVNVGGNRPAVPIIDIYGPCASPLVRCQDTGLQVMFTDLAIAAGDYLEVDLGARTVRLNGDPEQSRYGWLDFAQSDWWTLPTGPAVGVVFSASAATGAKALLTWRSRYL